MHWKKVLKPLLVAGVLAGTIGLMAGCGSDSSAPAASKDAKLQVVTTIYPVYDVAKQVGGDKVDVKLLVPLGSEPHDWEPTAAQLKEIGNAKVFLYSGAGMEPTEKILTKDVLKDAKPYELSKAVKVMKAAEDEDEDDDHDKDAKQGEAKEEHHHHSEYDPHVWLDPTNVIKEVKMVVQAFSEADPTNADYYKKNGDAYIAKLEKLDKEWADYIKTMPNKNIVVSHQAFGYLAAHYGLTQIGIMGISPDAEPTPERMAQIVAFIKEHHVKAIYSEEFVNQKLAEAIAKETGAKIYVLNPAENLTQDEMDKGTTYLQIMEENLKTLKKSVE